MPNMVRNGTESRTIWLESKLFTTSHFCAYICALFPLKLQNLARPTSSRLERGEMEKITIGIRLERTDRIIDKCYDVILGELKERIITIKEKLIQYESRKKTEDS